MNSLHGVIKKVFSDKVLYLGEWNVVEMLH